jgi:hypothetical protein
MAWPLHFGVPPKIKERVWENKYVDFGVFLKTSLQKLNLLLSLPVTAMMNPSTSWCSILGPKSTLVDMVPGGQTIRVSVEGVPPSTISDVVCPPVKGVTDPAASVPDASHPPLTIPDSATSVDRNLEVLRGLSEPELLTEKFRSCYEPSKQLSLDEGTCGFKGRVAFRVYNKDKPKKWGIKLYELCDSENGFCWEFEIFTGLERMESQEKTHDTVMALMNRHLDKGHAVYMHRSKAGEISP